MQDLKLPLEASYQSHPAFRFDAPSWSLDPQMLATFNTSYLAARQMGSMLSGEGLNILHDECLRDMQAVYASLQAQSNDQHERQFLVELASECARLLHEELTWFQRPLKQGAHALRAEPSRKAAVRMQADRHFFGQLPATAVKELQQIAAADIDRFRASAAAG